MRTDKGTKNFTVRELRCRCVVCDRKIPHTLTDAALDNIQLFRDIYGVAFTPNSAFRCAIHPDEVKKAKPGQHHHGAIDVPTGKDKAMKYRVVAAAIAAGCSTIIIYDTFVHLDWRPRPLALLWSAE